MPGLGVGEVEMEQLLCYFYHSACSEGLAIIRTGEDTGAGYALAILKLNIFIVAYKVCKVSLLI
jgi:hypothetical protein